MEPTSAGGALFQIIFLVLTQVPFAMIVYGWGKRMQPSVGVRSIFLALVPLIGYFYFYWFAYKTVRYLLDKVALTQDQ